MPATEISQYSISNIGPLTTVFTAPSACATATRDLYVGSTDDPLSNGKVQIDLWYAQQCDVASLGECYPSGSALDAQYSSRESAGDYTGAGTLAYFSPANACPDAYATVGVAVKNDAGEVSSSGVFVPPVVTDSGFPPRWNPPLNVFMEALDKGETAVICCPAEYTVGINGGCYSQVPWSEYGETTACFRMAEDDSWYTRANATFTYNKTVVTNEVYTYTATSVPPITSTTTTLDEDVTSSMVPFKAAVGVTLVYNSAAPAETSPNAAQGWKMTTSGGGVGILATAWGLAGLVGMALAMPW